MRKNRLECVALAPVGISRNKKENNWQRRPAAFGARVNERQLGVNEPWYDPVKLGKTR